jgi:hypothetical protein
VTEFTEHIGFLRRGGERANTPDMRLVAPMILATALFGSAHADGDSLVDMLGPREIAVGEAMRGGATGSSAIGLNPAGLPLNQELVFEGGYGYRPTDQASLVNVSACDSTAPVPGCFYYDYAGSSPELSGMSMHRTTHVAGTSLAYPVSPRVMIGTSVKYLHFSTDVMGESNASGINFDLGTTVKVNDQISVGVAGYNLWGTESPQWARAAGGGVLARPIQMLALSFDARWKLVDGDHSARYGGGAELFLRSSNGQQGYPLRIGALHDSGLGTTYISGGLGLAGMKFGIDLAARKAVSGPTDETIFIASMRIYGPRIGPNGEPAPE